MRNRVVIISLILNMTLFTGCGDGSSGYENIDDKPTITLYGDREVTLELGTTSLDSELYGYRAIDPQDGDIYRIRGFNWFTKGGLLGFFFQEGLG